MMNKQLSDLKEERAEKRMNLEHKLRAQVNHGRVELSRLKNNDDLLMTEKRGLIRSISNNKFLTEVDARTGSSVKNRECQEKGKQIAKQKLSRVHSVQLIEQEKEKNKTVERY